MSLLISQRLSLFYSSWTSTLISSAFSTFSPSSLRKSDCFCLWISFSFFKLTVNSLLSNWLFTELLTPSLDLRDGMTSALASRFYLDGVLLQALILSCENSWTAVLLWSEELILRLESCVLVSASWRLEFTTLYRLRVLFFFWLSLLFSFRYAFLISFLRLLSISLLLGRKASSEYNF